MVLQLRRLSSRADLSLLPAHTPDRRFKETRQGIHLDAVSGLLARVDSFESPQREPLLVIDELGDARVDRLRGDDAPRRDRLHLPDAVHSVDSLRLLRRSPAELSEYDV